MLVLSRFRDESIMVGDDVEIVVVDIRYDKVRLGITAPRQIPVHRMEIFKRIKAAEAAKLKGNAGETEVAKAVVKNQDKT